MMGLEGYFEIAQVLVLIAQLVAIVLMWRMYQRMDEVLDEAHGVSAAAHEAAQVANQAAKALELAAQIMAAANKRVGEKDGR